ncbi:MAG: hypothetical protein Kow0013_05990 [Pararhodobacter sp.]
MRTGKGIAGATLLYGPQSAAPDLLLAMQFLLDDLRGDGRRVSGLRLSGGTLRLRCDGYEIILTLAPQPLPPGSFDGVMRPAPADPARPDVARVHFHRLLQRHGHALGFLMRRRNAAPADPASGALALAGEARLALLPVLEAAPPDLLVWHPGGLVLTLDEFRALKAEGLLIPGDPESRFHLLPRDTPPAIRPPGAGQVVPLHPHPRAPKAPDSRLARASARSGGRLFGGTPGPHPKPSAGPERASSALAAALRQDATAPPPVRTLADRVTPLTVAALWAALLPHLVTGLLPYL